MKKSIGDSNFIEKAMAYSSITDSKMIRAGLIVASGRINKNIHVESLLTLATAIELIHTYSLIHDDLPSMDDDDFRRGKESNHIKFGEANAILAGDALQALAYEVICDDKKLDSKNKIEAIKLISNACGKNGMVLGQHLDIDSESKDINIKDVDNIHSLKTGKLIECSVMLGQINNNDEKTKEVLNSFGKKIGLAFQITDDILEAISDQSILGKNNNSDLKNNKSTYIKVIGLKEAKNKSHELSSSAIKSLEELLLTETNMLIELAKYISYREK
jgi:geranylgeranyl pyrophosphate synthase